MNVRSIERKLKKAFGDDVIVRFEDGCLFLTGEVKKYEDAVRACQLAAKKNSTIHVVNDINVLESKKAAMRLPKLKDKALDGSAPDVLIVGGGVSGAAIARELSRYKLDVLLVEKESDLALAASGRNDGEVHPGVDLPKGSLKQHYVLLGNKMYGELCRDLNVPFKRVGQYAGFTQGILKPFVWLFAMQRRSIGVPNTRVMSKRELLEREPNLNKDFKFAIYDESAGCVCPYGLTIALCENAVDNGVRISLNTAVLGMAVENGKIASVSTNRGTIYPKYVVNAAGVYAEEIAKMAQDRFYSIHPRRGTNSILDRKSAYLVNGISSIKKVERNKAHTKGGGILHTVHDNLLVGPDAVETEEKENYATNADSIARTFNKQRNTVEKLSERDIITYFTGVRAPTFEEDFVIEWGRHTRNLYHVAGIQSPGLTTAPAVAVDVVKSLVERMSEDSHVERNERFSGKRKGVPVLRDLPLEERDRLIKENPDYGEIVCRCEEVSKGEILDALKSSVCVPTVDGIKKRLRPGMGRCQGGFCSPLVTKIIADYLNVPIEDVRKSSEDSVIVFGETKGAK